MNAAENADYVKQPVIGADAPKESRWTTYRLNTWSDDRRPLKYVERRCDAVDCDRLAEWAYIGEGGDLYLCLMHAGGDDDVEGWQRVNRR